MTEDQASESQALANYEQLLHKVDAKFSEIRARHQDAFQCSKGCHGCCKPGLTVGALEAFAIRKWLDETPTVRQEIATLIQADPYRGACCRLLTTAGTCSIYDARPIVCRSHGAPLKFKEHGADKRDVCPLNFAGDVSTLSGDDVINLDLLNTLLALIGRQFSTSEERVPLEALVAANDSRLGF